MQSSRVRLMLVALLGVFAFSAVATAVAQAETEEAPFWSINKVRLGAGETHYITAKINEEGGAGKTIKLTAGTTSVTCKKLKLAEGVLLGSAVGNPGTNDEVIEFSECAVAGNGAKCLKVKEPIVTNSVKSELVLDVATHEKLLVEFFTEKGPFVKLIFAGVAGNEKCTIGETSVEGNVAAEVLSDPTNTGKSYLLNFPATPIKEVLLVKNSTTEVKKIELRAFSEEASLTGTALILLANAKRETESTEWSPLL
jgi:hypothetical protein